MCSSRAHAPAQLATHQTAFISQRLGYGMEPFMDFHSCNSSIKNTSRPCIVCIKKRGHYFEMILQFGLGLLMSSLIFSSEHKTSVQSCYRRYNSSIRLSAPKAWLHI